MMSRRPLLMVVVAALLAMMVSSSQTAVLPGFKITLSQSGLDYAKQVGLDFVQKKFQTINVPDQGGSAGLSILGTINWQLTSIQLSGLSISSSSTINIVTGTGIAINVAGISVTANMNFGYQQQQWPHISGSGSLRVGISSTSVYVNLAVGETDGQPSLSVISSSCSIGGLSIQESGGPSWLIDFFLNVLSNVIKNAVQNALGPAIASLVNGVGNNALKTVPMHQDFGDVAEVDYSFVQPPTFGNASLTVNTRGEFYMLPSKPEAPLAPVPMPDTATAEMLQVFVGDYVPNTASYVFYKAGKMQGQLTDSDLPSWSPIRLNTSSWGLLIPGLPAAYPNMMMVAAVSALQAPYAEFTPKGISVVGAAQVVVSAIGANNTLFPAFAIGVTLSASANVSVVNGTGYAQLAYVNSNFTVMYTKVGTIYTDGLNIIISGLSQYAIIPFLNFYLSHGVVIPTVQGVSLDNPTIGYGQNYVYVSTNISYAGP